MREGEVVLEGLFEDGTGRASCHWEDEIVLRRVKRLMGSLPRGRLLIGAIAITVAFAPILVLGAVSNPSALWNIVDGRCMVDQRDFGRPAPCTRLDLKGGYAVLKDIVGKSQYLLIATMRVSGIESPLVLSPSTPNYFAEAWAQTGLVSRQVGRPLPRQDLSLAINSVFGRTQNQLHIHIDCLRIDVAAALARHAATLSHTWSPFPEPLAGHHYLAMRVMGPALGSADPFRLLARGLPGAASHMGDYTLVVAGIDVPGAGPGFILLAGKADPAHGNFGSGEELQDHSCAISHLQPAM
jgi:CDP-diacylglycerol pyrophosphatase